MATGMPGDTCGSPRRGGAAGWSQTGSCGGRARRARLQRAPGLPAEPGGAGRSWVAAEVFARRAGREAPVDAALRREARTRGDPLAVGAVPGGAAPCSTSTRPTPGPRWGSGRPLARCCRSSELGRRGRVAGALRGRRGCSRWAARAEATEVGPAAVEALEEVAELLARAYATTEPHVLLAQVSRRAGEVAALLDRRSTLAQRRRLLVVGGWLALLGATLHVDLGDRPAAVGARTAAASLGRETDHREIAAWAVEIAAWTALTDQDWRRAARLAPRGRRWLRPGRRRRCSSRRSPPVRRPCWATRSGCGPGSRGPKSASTGSPVTAHPTTTSRSTPASSTATPRPHWPGPVTRQRRTSPARSPTAAPPGHPVGSPRRGSTCG